MASSIITSRTLLLLLQLLLVLQSSLAASLSSVEVLKLARQTQNGISASPGTASDIKTFIAESKASYEREGRSALTDDRLYGNFDVAYVGVGGDQVGNPAGGRFRGSLGRLIYRNEGLYQHILRSDNDPRVVNYIRGKLFSCIPLGVVLNGTARALPQEELLKVNARLAQQPGCLQLSQRGVVEAKFQPPLLQVGPFALQIGPPSSVILDTPYVDEHLRTGLGSRGSLFVFERIKEEGEELRLSNAYASGRQVLIKARAVGRSLLAAAACILGWNAPAWVSCFSRVGRGKGVLLGLLRSKWAVGALTCALLGSALLRSKGGIIDEQP